MGKTAVICFTLKLQDATWFTLRDCNKQEAQSGCDCIRVRVHNPRAMEFARSERRLYEKSSSVGRLQPEVEYCFESRVQVISRAQPSVCSCAKCIIDGRCMLPGKL
jgi:hypothetical protein